MCETFCIIFFSRWGICGVTVIAEVAQTGIATNVEATGVAIVDTGR